MPKFIERDPLELQDNMFRRIGREWMLITAGSPENFNFMTASWGGTGVMWNLNVTFTVVRPSRYTYAFMEQGKYYTLSFFGADCRRALQLCGSKSGRDIDKVAESGLTPVFDAQAPYFAEAELVLVCRKLYTQDLETERFLDPTLMVHYPDDDVHRLYVGEIVKVLQRIP